MYLLVFMLAGCNSKAENIDLNTVEHYSSDLVVNDRSINEHFVEGATRLLQSGDYVRLEELATQLMNITNHAELNIQTPDTTYTSYNDLKKSTLVIAQMYEMDNQPGLKLSPATGFIIDERGICVTNYHVFEKLGQPMRGAKLLTAMDYAGNILPIEEILCASEKHDIAVFRVKTGNTTLQAIPLSHTQVAVGEEMNLISHPIGNYYEFTRGYARRYFISRETGTLRLTTSVPFAVSSSGGAMYNNRGQVVAVVSSTSPYIGGSGDHRMIQMVNYETIPVSILRRMVGLDK